MSLMTEQLLKAGLVTEEQVQKANKKTNNKQKARSAAKHGNRQKPANKQHGNKNKQRKKTVNQEKSDLETFYRMRSAEENKEKQEALRKKKEAALRKKQINKKINKLILDNALEINESADIRYNFVVGTTIKYLFVTPEQQAQLAKGELAITFLKGKRFIIPVETARKILEINPDKMVVMSVSLKGASTN